MLKWWFRHYLKHNRYPIYFADFGVSRECKDWCSARGELINLRFRIHKRSWFKKPMAVLRTSAKKILWIDLDCEIRGDVGLLFKCIKENYISVTLDPHNPWIKTKDVVASGIVGTAHNNPLIIKWAEGCLSAMRLRGDQEVLNAVIETRREQVLIMPPEYQWLRIDGPNQDALIFHWTGVKGKDMIRRTLGLPPLYGRYHAKVGSNKGASRSNRKRKKEVTSILALRNAKRHIARMRAGLKVNRNISVHKSH